jgi:uncharacterized protein (TIGR02996 family)
MTDLDRLLAGIAAEPDEPAHRLVLADWLEETGGAADQARAALLRLQARWEGLPEGDERRPPLQEEAAAIQRKFRGLAGALPRVDHPELPLLGTGLALAAFLTAEGASPPGPPLDGSQAWTGTLRQGGDRYVTNLTVRARQGCGVAGEIAMDFGFGFGRFSFEGAVLAGRLLFLVTDRIDGPVTVPGLYAAELLPGPGVLEGTWRVPRYHQQGTFRLRPRKE